MSEIRATRDYYLTENGWFEGSSVPDNSVEHWRVEASQLTYVTPETRDWSNIWNSPKHSRAQRDELRRRYPFPDEVRPHPMRRSTFRHPLP